MGCFMYAFGSSNAAALIALPSLISPSDAFMSRRSETTLVLVSTAGILSRLAEAARGILSESENVVLREPSKIPVPRGTIHPLTRYAMNYASLISNYKQTLVELIVSKHARYGFHRAGRADSIGPPFDLDHCDFAVQFRGKSKHYKDTSLAHLFMMNNVHYIVQKIKGSPKLREMIGDYYLRKLIGKEVSGSFSS
nr:exocyst complex component EXO70A1-like [Ipomoea batatas]